MGEQFSDNVRSVLDRAEAEAWSRNLSEVSSELVLLALAAIEGTAAHVLRALTITPERLGDCMPVATSPKPTPRPVPFGESAVRAVNGAQHEADRMGHGFVGTEHLLLGALAEPSGRVSEVLTRIGRDAVVTRERLLDLLVSPGFVSPEAPRVPEKIEAVAAPATATVSPVLDPPPPARPVIDLRADSADLSPGNGPAGAGHASNGHGAPASPPSVPGPWPASFPAADSDAVVTALLGEMVLLRAEIAALRAEIGSMRSTRH